MKRNHLLKASEVEIHYKRPLLDSMSKITNSEEAVTVLKSFVTEERLDLKEFFWVMLLTRSNRVLGISEIGSGTASGVTVNIKEIVQLVVLSNASAVILSHNHPSGNLKPSNQDVVITDKVKLIGEVVDFKVLDHIILTSEGGLSMSDEGLLNN